MFSTYKDDDVVILLKDISGLVKPLDTQEREQRIQSGTHYSEMLPLEYEPSAKYLEIYEAALNSYAGITAQAVAVAAEKIWQQKGRKAVLVSLARAGTPIGILIKRYLRKKYRTEITHYTISIIRGKGLDDNAMKYILARHAPNEIQFVDGWTGKGAIQRELNQAVENYAGISPGLAVLSDPAYISEKCGTHEDFLIPSSCLNSTISGLLSRTFLRDDIIGQDDFHGAVFYRELMDKDLTYQFIDRIEANFPTDILCKVDSDTEKKSKVRTGLDETREISQHFGIADINLVKPSIGETTRVLLRRIPWKILVYSLNDTKNLGHIYQLATEKGVEVVEYPLQNYRACGLIKSLADN
ncbi:cysteine protease StiP family protein [bacterium]|nr:cysteine protease StiP family protein [bacterium]